MKLTNHAIKRIIQRNKAASFMAPKQLDSFINSAEMITQGNINYFLLKSIDLVLVVNRLNGNVITAYDFKNSKFNERN